VYGILSDGALWMFFCFRRTVSPGGAVQLNVLRGALPSPSGCELLQYSTLPFQSSRADYVRVLLPACEYIYSILLAGFLNSLDTFYTEKTRRAGGRRLSGIRVARWQGGTGEGGKGCEGGRQGARRSKGRVG